MKPCQIEKKQRLLNSAVRLFLKNGINETSVNEIVKDAKLAKGTFYIYYKDKSELIHEIVGQKNVALIRSLIDSARQDQKENEVSWSCAFVKRLIVFYEENPSVLKLIYHSFFINEERPFSIRELHSQIPCFDEFIRSFRKEQEQEQDAWNRFLIILEMCVAVCYNAIFFQQPASLDQIKEMFITSICEVFANGQGGVS